MQSRFTGPTQLPDVEQKRKKSRLRVFILCGCVIVAGITISGLIAWDFRLTEGNLARIQFALDAGKRIEAIQRSVENRLSSVSTVTAFFNGSQWVSRNEFHTFTEPFFESQPGIVVLGWVPRIPANLRDAHQDAVRRQGFPDYKIYQQNDHGQNLPATSDVECYPVLFVEPLRENHSLVGLDLNSCPPYHRAIDQAIRTRRQTAIVCQPLNDTKNHPNLLYVFQPAWNEHDAAAKRPPDQPEIDGFVLGVFYFPSIVEAALKDFTPVGIDIEVKRLSNPNEITDICRRPSPLRKILSESAETTVPPSLGSNEPSVTGHLEIANLTFSVICTPLHAYLQPFHTWEPIVVFSIGAMLTFLIVGYLLLLTQRTAQVEQLAMRRARELNISEQRFRHLVNNAADAFFLRQPNGKILDVNQRACDDLGYSRDELLTKNILDLATPLISSRIDEYSSLPLDQYPLTFEALHHRKDGTSFPVEVRMTVMDVDGQRFILALSRDITEQKKLIEKLQEGERKIRAILDQTFQFIGLLTPEGILTAANKSALAFCGVSESDVLQKPFWDTPWWTHSPALQEKLRLSIQRAAQGEFIRMEATHRNVEGEIHWIDFSLKPVKDHLGNVLFLIPEGRDITDRKRAEEAAYAEQRLLREMLDLHEREHKVMAYELHDGLAQQLTGALFKFQLAEQQIHGDINAVKEICADGMGLLREAIVETRRLIAGLRPPVLDELGTVAAVEDLVAQHRKQGGVEIEFLHDDEIRRLAPPLESVVFRIIQECVTNARRHSGSPNIRIELHHVGERIRIDVRDWGVGFKPAEVGGDHYGLMGIRERARLFGGFASIETEPGQGVHIAVELPVIFSPESMATRPNIEP
jgi:PAS domain S-box-containing protein